MRIYGPNGFKAAAYEHDGKMISGTKNLGPCSNWTVQRFERMCKAQGWWIERDDVPADAEQRAGDR